MRWLALIVLALALVAAGCGGGDDESSAADDTTIEETTTTDETTSEDTTTDETTTSGDADFDFADEDCQALLGVGAAFAQAITGATDQEALEAFQQLADNVPDEIQADVQVLADWFAEYAAKLEDIGIQAGQTPSAEQLQQLVAALSATNQEEVSAASERLGTWADENCDAGG